ncbi:4Fe-4S dicluster domain-containing protein [Deferrisoma sp.]
MRQLHEARCVRLRCREAGCRACADACPRGAIAFEDRVPRLDPAGCQDCGACAAACPVEAWGEASPGFAALPRRLVSEARPVLGCRAEGVEAHERVPCLGALSREHLLALAAFVPQGVWLNATRCAECPLGEAVAGLEEKIRTLPAGWGPRLWVVRTADALGFRPRACDRRGFFRSLRSGVVGRAAEWLAAGASGAVEEARSRKRVPERVVLREAALATLPPDERGTVRGAVAPGPRRGEGCTACGRCAAVCPTGAMERVREAGRRQVKFLPERCTGCGACAAFCPRGAMSMGAPTGPAEREAA